MRTRRHENTEQQKIYSTIRSTPTSWDGLCPDRHPDIPPCGLPLTPPTSISLLFLCNKPIPLYTDCSTVTIYIYIRIHPSLFCLYLYFPIPILRSHFDLYIYAHFDSYLNRSNILMYFGKSPRFSLGSSASSGRLLSIFGCLSPPSADGSISYVSEGASSERARGCAGTFTRVDESQYSHAEVVDVEDLERIPLASERLARACGEALDMKLSRANIANDMNQLLFNILFNNENTDGTGNGETEYTVCSWALNMAIIKIQHNHLEELCKIWTMSKDKLLSFTLPKYPNAPPETAVRWVCGEMISPALSDGEDNEAAAKWGARNLSCTNGSLIIQLGFLPTPVALLATLCALARAEVKHVTQRKRGRRSSLSMAKDDCNTKNNAEDIYLQGYKDKDLIVYVHIQSPPSKDIPIQVCVRCRRKLIRNDSSATTTSLREELFDDVEDALDDFMDAAILHG